MATAAGPSEIAEQREELDRLVVAMCALPDAQRQALVKRELEGVGHGEIAAQLGTTATAVRGLIFRARTGLRDAVGALSVPFLRILLSDVTARDRRRRGRGGGAGAWRSWAEPGSEGRHRARGRRRRAGNRDRHRPWPQRPLERRKRPRRQVTQRDSAGHRTTPGGGAPTPVGAPSHRPVRILERRPVGGDRQPRIGRRRSAARTSGKLIGASGAAPPGAQLAGRVHRQPPHTPPDGSGPDRADPATETVPARQPGAPTRPPPLRRCLGPRRRR